VIAYVDASVILRLALGQPNGLTEWSKVQRGVSNALITTESLRTLDLERDDRRGHHDRDDGEALGLSAKAHGLAVVGLAK